MGKKMNVWNKIMEKTRVWSEIGGKTKGWNEMAEKKKCGARLRTFRLNMFQLH